MAGADRSDTYEGTFFGESIREYASDRFPEIPGFEIVRKIGQGGMGLVYLARQKSLDRLVALKLLLNHADGPPRTRERFRREAVVAARAGGESIVHVHDSMDLNGTLVIVMEYVDGRDLGRILHDRLELRQEREIKDPHPASLLDEGPFLEFLNPILDQVAGAMASIHRAKILHRDVKPSNILIDAGSRARLSDFGLASLGGESPITLVNHPFGTPGYMAPEQWSGDEVLDPKTDVFGLGCTFYYSLTGRLPYGAKPLVRGRPITPPERPSRIRPELSADHDAVILKALEPVPGDRYKDAAEFEADWSRVRRGETPKARNVGLLRRGLRRVLRRPGAPLNIALVLLIVTIFFALWLSRLGVVPEGMRIVEFSFKPPDARFAVVPLDNADGQPRYHDVRFGEARKGRPTRLTLPYGDCLIEAVWPDGRFHEVYRHVPRPDERTKTASSQHWEPRPDGAVSWYAIAAPPADVLEDMVYFPGTDEFAPPPDPDEGWNLVPRAVPAFYLDAREVTMRAFWRQKPGSVYQGPTLRDIPGDYANPVRMYNFPLALHDAERLGKRLPDEAEYLFAATDGGTRRFPWGDAPRSPIGSPWPIGRAGMPAWDATPGSRPVFGLYSNVVEWTRVMPYERLRLPGEVGSTVRNIPLSDSYGVGVIRGGPVSALRNPAEPLAKSGEPSNRLLLMPESFAPWGGFRGARSASPHFFGNAPSPLPRLATRQ